MAHFVKEFLIGGTIISGVKLLSQYTSPSVAALLGGLPTGVIASFFLNSKKDKKEYYDGYIYSSFILFLSVVVIHFLLNKTTLPADPVAAAGLVAWAIFSYTLFSILGLTKK